MKIFYRLFLALCLVCSVDNFLFARKLRSGGDNVPVKRVVALTSLGADLVASLDREVLFGVPGTSLTKNDRRYVGIKRISSGRSQPSIESIVSLEPDLVIGATGFHSKVLGSLERLGIPTLAFKIDRWNRLENAVEVLSRRIPNNGELKSRLARVCPPISASQRLKKDKTSVLILAGIAPKLSPNKQSWSGSLLERRGLLNATDSLPGTSQFSGYITMSNERLLSVKPGKVLVINPSGGVSREQLSLRKFFPALSAGDFISMDYYGLINPGSLKSISKACAKLLSL